MSNAKTDTETSTKREARYAIGATREERYENARKMLATARGRPRKGSKAQGSSARSLRLPDATWVDLEAAAKARKMTLHRFLRVIVAEHLYSRTTHEYRAAKLAHVAETKARKSKAAKPAKAGPSKGRSKARSAA